MREDPVVALHRLDDLYPLTHGSGHWLFAPDVLARLSCRDRHQPVPVRGRGDVNDVNVGPVEYFAEVAIGVDARAGPFDCLGQMVLVDVTNSEKSRALIAYVALTHAADADDGLGKLVTRGGVPLPPENLPRDESYAGRESCRALDEATPVHDPLLFHVECRRPCGRQLHLNFDRGDENLPRR